MSNQIRCSGLLNGKDNLGSTTMSNEPLGIRNGTFQRNLPFQYPHRIQLLNHRQIRSTTLPKAEEKAKMAEIMRELTGVL